MNDNLADTNPPNQPEPVNPAPLQTPNTATTGFDAAPLEPPPGLPASPVYEAQPQSPAQPPPNPEQPPSKSLFWAIGIASIIVLVLVGFSINQLIKNRAATSILPIPEARCLPQKVYDQNWQILGADQLSRLKPGDKIKLVVGGQTNTGAFDRARFKINSSDFRETAVKQPQTDSFFLEYTIPPETTSFKIEAGVHHSSLGWL